MASHGQGHHKMNIKYDTTLCSSSVKGFQVCLRGSLYGVPALPSLYINAIWGIEDIWLCRAGVYCVIGSSFAHDAQANCVPPNFCRFNFI